MHWLQALDTGLFRFVNRSLVNPFFDWLMPVLRGDAFITNTIKHAVARPRPYVTLPEARYFGSIGKSYIPPEAGDSGVDMAANKGSRTSMPSAHAANWFAATMILFIFYRRSLWFMLPMALAVSLSRVYNGVHIPATCSSARFWARVTRRRERLRCKRGGGGLEKNGSRSGTRNCPRS